MSNTRRPRPASSRATESSYPQGRAFVVQFPPPSGNGAEEVARVEHVTSGRSIHFTDEQTLLAFINDVLADEGGRARMARSETGLRLLTETIPHMLWSATDDGQVDYVNQRVLDYAQLPYEQFLGAGWGAAIHPDHVVAMAEAWGASVTSGEPFQFEFLGRHAPSGTWRWCVSSALPARDAEGRIIKWYGSIVDLHDRKQAEETRLQAERQYRTVVETATDAVITIDEDSTIVLVNPAVTRVFGFDAGDLIGRPLTVLMPQALALRHRQGIVGSPGTELEFAL